MCFLSDCARLNFSYLYIYILHQIWKIFGHDFLKCFSALSFPFWKCDYAFALSLDIVPEIIEILIFSVIFLYASFYIASTVATSSSSIAFSSAVLNMLPKLSGEHFVTAIVFFSSQISI